MRTIKMARYQSTKTYGTDRGLSCCFRQWKASHSHCSTLHGYSLGFKFVWESETLDSRNWVFDFGGMKPIKQYLDSMFDHTVLVAEDDPALEMFKTMAGYSTDPQFNGTNKNIGYLNPIPHEESRICALRVVPGVGCEMTAKMVFEEAQAMLDRMKSGEMGRYDVNPDVRLVSVECFEHGANSAIYYGDDVQRRSFHVDVAEVRANEIAMAIESSLRATQDQTLSERISSLENLLQQSQGVKVPVEGSGMGKVVATSYKSDPQVIGNLEPFVDVLNDLNRHPPLDDHEV
jgi:6-pyruvoyltetrahydropterin/6-carboxytetrahydropterin synthase